MKTAGWLCLAALLMAAGDPDRDPPKVTHEAVKQAPMGSAILVRAKIEDASGIFAPSLAFRPIGSKDFDTIELRKRGEFHEASIPAEQVTTDLEYFIETFDDQGNGPSRVGSPETPILIRVFDPSSPPPRDDLIPPATSLAPADDGDSVLGAWWFWTILGVAAAGAVGGALLVAGNGVDAVDIVVRAPDPTEAVR